MKIKFLLILMFGLCLASCSSTQSNTPELETPLQATPAQTQAAPESVLKDDLAKAVQSAAVVEPSLTQELSQAIKAQNDQQIQLLCEKILAQNRSDEKALSSLGLVYYRKNNFERSRFFLSRAASVASLQKNEKALHYVNLGLVEYALGEKNLAIRNFRKALEISPEDGSAAANLGAIYAREKDYAKAVIALEMAHRRGPRDLKTLNNYAVSLMANGQFDKSLNIYDEALKENASSREVLVNKSILLIDHMARLKEGLDVIQKLKFLGIPSESRDRLSVLENKAKSGLK
jgi:tetratricopeptide (TPR) repeat protein